MNPLSYITSGDDRNPAVLFLHGFMGSAEDWSGVVAALEDRFYCIAVDLPGHGGSLRLPYPDSYTMDGAARRLLDLLDAEDVDRCVVAGYSMGGRLALYLALRHPERCAGLFLESASPGLETEAEQTARRETDDRRANRLETEDFKEFLEDWFRQPIFVSLARDQALLGRTIESRRRNDPAELAKSLRAMGTGCQPSLWDELPGLRIPALAVAGAMDEKFVKIANSIAASSSVIRATVIPGAGHNVHVEALEAYIRLLEDFLRGVAG